MRFGCDPTQRKQNIESRDCTIHDTNVADLLLMRFFFLYQKRVRSLPITSREREREMATLLFANTLIEKPIWLHSQQKHIRICDP